ncbi:MAG TPA: DUF3455 domain-containing protein, partial [Polyangiaceae bacterium]|nr:DUF3455 domain-containing protein [Polyangiaceae bacterium]
MKKELLFCLVAAVAGCSGDDNNGNSAQDAATDGTTTDDATTGDDGATGDDVTAPKDGASGDASSSGGGDGGDAGAQADASDSGDAGSGEDASDSGPVDSGPTDGGADSGDDGGCPGTWFVAPAYPGALAVPDGGGAVVLHALGTGTQNYACTAATNDAGVTSYTWTLTGPTADLHDCHDAVIGHHFASEGGAGFPEWQTTDGTYVVGTKAASVTPDGGASVAWLLLHAVDAGGSGALSTVQYVQRLDTDGG